MALVGRPQPAVGERDVSVWSLTLKGRANSGATVPTANQAFSASMESNLCAVKGLEGTLERPNSRSQFGHFQAILALGGVEETKATNWMQTRNSRKFRIASISAWDCRYRGSAVRLQIFHAFQTWQKRISLCYNAAIRIILRAAPYSIDSHARYLVATDDFQETQTGAKVQCLP